MEHKEEKETILPNHQLSEEFIHPTGFVDTHEYASADNPLKMSDLVTKMLWEVIALLRGTCSKVY